MADFVFNVAKGKAAEKLADATTSLGILILATSGLESDATLRDKTTLTDLVSGTTNEVTNSGYARKTSLTATVAVDQANDRTDVDVADQTWTAVAAGDGWSKLVTFIDEAGTDGTRIPLTAHDFVVTPDGSDITAQIAAAGFYRAS
jgi:hypothetical protein